MLSPVDPELRDPPGSSPRRVSLQNSRERPATSPADPSWAAPPACPEMIESGGDGCGDAMNWSSKARPGFPEKVKQGIKRLTLKCANVSTTKFWRFPHARPRRNNKKDSIPCRYGSAGGAEFLRSLETKNASRKHKPHVLSQVTGICEGPPA